MAERDDVLAEGFLRRFALPLVRGGQLHVGAPLGAAGLRRLRLAAAAGLDGTEAGQELSEARLGIVGELLLRAEPPLLGQDEGALALLVALHDLLFVLHPGAQALLGAERRLRRVLLHTAALCQRAAPGLRAQGRAAFARLLAERHSLLHALWVIGRNDVRISFWAGRQEFLGTEPPQRLLAWRGLRRVQEERWRVLWYLQLLGLGGGEGRRALDALLLASPLTDLLTPRRLDPPLDLSRHAPILLLPGLSRAVAYQYLEMGLLETGGALGASITRLLGAGAGRPVRADVSTLLQFVSHLHLCALLSTEEADAAEALPHLGGDAGLRDFYGLYAAVHLGGWPGLAAPADVARDASLRDRAQRYAGAVARAVGRQRMDELIGLCAGALASDSPPAQPPPPVSSLP